MALPTLPAMLITRSLLHASWQSWIGNNLRPPVGPRWLQWLWTLLFCAALAVVFTVLGFLVYGRRDTAWNTVSAWLHWYGRHLVVSLCIGVVIHAQFDAARRLLRDQDIRRWPGWQRTLLFSGLPLLGVAIGWPVGMALVGSNVMRWIGTPEGNSIIVGTIVVSLLMAFLFHSFFSSRSRRIEAERRATEAQLRLLQGQIEPHFLFNTLANVVSLIDTDAARAKQMLESFTDYLRSSLGALRHDASTLGAELDLARTYLELLKVRMEDRLRFTIDVDPALRETPLPPLLLQPLVENAIHHGLEPKVDGGSITVSARAAGRVMTLEVRDDGLGLAAPARRRRGAGMALANLRERLAAQYGDGATLDLADAGPGTRVTIVIPRIPLEAR
jgi:two-component sensor histidine kinase